MEPGVIISRPAGAPEARYWKLPEVTIAMTTSSCRSSYGRSAGPCEQTTSSTDQPAPAASVVTAIFAKSRSPAATYNLYHKGPAEAGHYVQHKGPAEAGRSR